MAEIITFPPQVDDFALHQYIEGLTQSDALRGMKAPQAVVARFTTEFTTVPVWAPLRFKVFSIASQSDPRTSTNLVMFTFAVQGEHRLVHAVR